VHHSIEGNIERHGEIKHNTKYKRQVAPSRDRDEKKNKIMKYDMQVKNSFFLVRMLLLYVKQANFL
jgi:hypothetical protein